MQLIPSEFYMYLKEYKSVPCLQHLNSLLVCSCYLVAKYLKFMFYLTANLSVTSYFVVCSFPNHHSNGSSLPAIRSCFTSWCAIACSYVPNTGRVNIHLIYDVHLTFNLFKSIIFTATCYVWWWFPLSKRSNSTTNYICY